MYVSENKILMEKNKKTGILFARERREREREKREREREREKERERNRERSRERAESSVVPRSLASAHQSGIFILSL